jgi:2-hydroxychromene-2-carboxylate isomerase
MGLHRLAELLGERVAGLELVPFWDPDAETYAALRAGGGDFHYVQMSKAKHLYILHDTKRQAQRLGLRMVWPVDVDPWWEVPHLAWLQAKAVGRAWPFYRAAAAARWERGANICDPEVVRALGAECGVDGELLADAARDPGLRRQAVDCLMAAYRDDVFGVPYFRLGFDRFWGLDRVDAFVDALSRPTASPRAKRVPAIAEPPKALAGAVGALDVDAAGGCG